MNKSCSRVVMLVNGPFDGQSIECNGSTTILIPILGKCEVLSEAIKKVGERIKMAKYCHAGSHVYVYSGIQ